MPLPRHRLRPHRDDVVISVGGLLGGLLLWGLGLHNRTPAFGLPGWPVLLALAVMSGAELLRRTAPVTALAVGAAALALDLLTGSLAATLLMFTDLVYAGVLYGTPAAARRIPIGCWLATAIATVLPLAVFRKPEALLLGLAAGLITVAPAWTGAIIRNHRERADAARLDAERTALLAERDRREAVIAERARMARELHDMVAGHLSAIAIHSTAALSLRDPGATDDALTVIRENSVQGLAEMRRLIDLLRDEHGEAERPDVAPTLDALDALLERARANGEPAGIRFTLRDRCPRGAPPLPAPVELAGYRIVQESVTNALKHAGPGEVTVELERESGGPLTVAVTSPLDDRPGPRAPGSGAGLVGMGERVELLGGRFEAGPVPGAGRTKVWQVRAVLPVNEEGTS